MGHGESSKKLTHILSTSETFCEIPLGELTGTLSLFKAVSDDTHRVMVPGLTRTTRLIEAWRTPDGLVTLKVESLFGDVVTMVGLSPYRRALVWRDSGELEGLEEYEDAMERHWAWCEGDCTKENE